jgi:hypothetical protein
MTDKQNPEEKPSFFDSLDEANSWPPSDGYEVEENQVIAGAESVEETQQEILQEVSEVNYEPDALDELLSSDVEAISTTNDDTPEYMVNVLMNDFSGGFDGKEEAGDSNTEEDFLTPKNQASDYEDEEFEEIEETAEEDSIEEVERSSFEQEDYTEQVNILDKGKIKIVDDDDALSDIFNNNPAEPLPQVEEIREDYSYTEVNDDDFDLESYVQEKTGKTRDYDYDSTSPASDLVDEYLEEEESKPFRTFASLNYTETPTEEVLEEKPGIFVGVNRNIIILALLILGILFYFLFTNLFKPRYDATGRKRDPRPAKQKRVAVESKELVPLWEVSAQKARSEASERQLVQTIYKTSGRDNPFALPESILADLRKAAQAELAKKMKPNTYRRLAYRATLVGVLTSNDNTIALVNQQEASFDVLEGTTKSKILGLATKAMDKAKRDTQEMVVGSYIGPWVITRIESPDSIFSDAKVHIQLNNNKKILNMGKAEELGIFTEEGLLDDLENPIGSLEMDLDDFDF